MQASKQEWDIKRLLDWAIKYFSLKETSQPKLSAELLLSSVLGLSRMQLYLNFSYIVKEKELAKFKEYIIRRLKNEPVQYILKEAFFRNLKLYVDENVLIPRPETELLVDKLLNSLKENKDEILRANKTVNILDIGSGSGNIAISIASEIIKIFPDASRDLWHIVATDMEKSAIEIAEKNAGKNLCNEELEKIEFINCDIIPDQCKDFKKKYKSGINIIISNPPYISVKDYEDLPDEVKNYEPRAALLAGDTGLEVYEKILDKIRDYVDTEWCRIFFETDPNTAEKLKSLIEKKVKAKTIAVDKDYNQKERIVSVII